MKKQFIAAVLSAAMAFSCAPMAYAADDTAESNGKVEISFKVGDSVLNINGVPTEVETPYVAGEGTTLVPLRVITEAFGAQVDWEDETEKITLTYPDVNIVLQIGNIVAQINNHSETLLEAPALVNDTTMVPLRFISETFGANVSYDDATEAILVTKEESEESQTVTGVTELPRTGDSYYNWSIETPRLMTMSDRHFDGKSTEFEAEDKSIFFVDIYKYTEDTITRFDEEFSKVKESLSNTTLIEAEKLVDAAGNKYMHFQARDKDDGEFIDIREYYGKDYTVYKVGSAIKKNDESDEIKNMILSIADSFKIGKIDNQTYDLSTVSDGMRIIEDDTYKLSFQIPAEYIQSSNYSDNEFAFYSPREDDVSTVHLGIFSKTDEVNAQKLAQSDHDNRVKIYNPEFSTISDVIKTEDGAYQYIQKISGSSANDAYAVDYFFDKGEYVYNMSITVPSEKDSDKAQKIIDSLETEELDASKVGKLLRNDPDDETMAANKVGKYKFSLPVSWSTKIGGSPQTNFEMQAFINSSHGSMISVSVKTYENYTSGTLGTEANSYSEYLVKQPGYNVMGRVEYDTIDGNQYAHFTVKITDDDNEVCYNTVYMRVTGKELIIFELYQEDIYYNGSDKDVLMNAIKSLSKE